MYYPVGAFGGTSETLFALTDIGSGGISRSAFSLNGGIDWDLIPVSDPSAAWIAAAADSEQWVAISSGTSAMTSPIQAVPEWSGMTMISAPGGYVDIRHNGDYYLALAHSGVGLEPAKAFKSITGETGSWTQYTVATFAPCFGLFWCEELGAWVAVGGIADPGKRILYSLDDAQTWTGATVDNAAYKHGVWTGTRAIVIGTGGFTRSTDLINWDPTSAVVVGNDIAARDGVVVAVSGNTAYVTTDEGDTWDSVTIGFFGGYAGITATNSGFCAVSYNDGVVPGQGISATCGPSGLDWTERLNMPGDDNWKVVRRSLAVN